MLPDAFVTYVPDCTETQRMFLYRFYDKRVIAIERWSFGTVVAASVTSLATGGALWWVFGDAIAKGAGDRIVVAALVCAAVGVSVPLRWIIARRLDGEPR